MLRIIAGEWGGRPIKSPKGQAARPTLGRVREAIFSVLGDAMIDARTLDLFAGSGALGFEALSRGAANCRFVESNDRHLRLIRENTDVLRAKERVTIRRGRLPGALKTTPDAPFDLVLMDPPYERDFVSPTLAGLVTNDWLAPDAILVVETRCGEVFETPDSMSEIARKRYGDTDVSFLRWEDSQ